MISGTLLAAQNSSDIVSKINRAEHNREDKLAGYTVTEHYEIYEPGNDSPVGEGRYKVTYTRGHGKTYELVGALDSKRPFVKGAVQRIIAGQQKASQPALRSRLLVTSDNYAMTLMDEGKTPKPSYICNISHPARKTRVLAIKPLHPGPALLEGFLWVDSENFHVVRIEGRFSTSPQIFVGRPTFERDYADLGGFAMATSSCQVAQGQFVHHRSEITYENYSFMN